MHGQQSLGRRLSLNDLALTSENVSANDARSMKRNRRYSWLRVTIALRSRELLEYAHDSAEPIFTRSQHSGLLDTARSVTPAKDVCAYHSSTIRLQEFAVVPRTAARLGVRY